MKPGPARFDSGQQAWILSSYSDVTTALRTLAASGTADDAHRSVRESASQLFAADPMAALRSLIETSASEFAHALPAGQPVDLVSSFAQPWSLAAAAASTGSGSEDLERLNSLAREVFLAAADGAQAPAAVSELARAFPGAAASAAVQAFVAMSQTLPCFLANAWLALIQNPEEAGGLRAEPALMPQAVEELLRFAGPSRAVFRIAEKTVEIGGANIAAGDRVMLMLSAANRDPAQFVDPGRLRLRRDSAGHLAFGSGPHTCAGASLIRMAAGIATGALLSATTAMELADEVAWLEGSAIRGPVALRVLLGKR